MLRKTRSLLTAALALALIGTADARADGLPVIDLDTTGSGVGAPDGASHYYAVAERGRTQLLEVASSASRACAHSA